MAHIGKVKIADVEFLDLSQHSPRKFSLYISIVIEADYLTMAMRAYRDDRGLVMHNVSWPEGDAVIEAISSFYASQPPK